jgi:hypothetical protein
MKKIVLLVVIFILLIAQSSLSAPLTGQWNAGDGIVSLLYPEGDGTTNIGDEFVGSNEFWSFDGLIRTEAAVMGDFINNGDGTATVDHENYRKGGTFRIYGDNLWDQEDETIYEISIQSHAKGSTHLKWVENNWVRTRYIGTILLWGEFINKPYLFQLTGDLSFDHKNSVSGTYSYPYMGEITNAKITIAPLPESSLTDMYFDTVQKVYIGYYQRPADPVGLLYWAQRLYRTNDDLNEIIEAFANSDESQTLYGTINSSNIAIVVDSIYMALFNRPAEAEGKAYYVNGFNEGRFTAATIMLNVLYGAQNQDLLSINNKVAASNLFTRTIDPDLDGYNFQVTYAGNIDVIEGRNFLSFVTWNSSTVPTQEETTLYMQRYIADPGDPIMGY